MGLRIVFPQNVLVPPDQASTFNIQWEIDESGQTAYEIQYKLKKDREWRTCGKVYDAYARETTFATIYEACPVEFYEIMYRVVVYLEGPNVIVDQHGETKEGISHSIITSASYWLIFQSFIENCLLKVYSPEYPYPMSFPLFDSITPESKELAEVDSVHINVGSADFPKKKILPLVQLDSPVAGELKVQTPTGTKVAMSQTANFRPTKLYSYGYVDQYVFDYYANYIDKYDKYYGYMPVYGYKTVYAYDHVYHQDPHYLDQYDYMQYYAEMYGNR